MFQSFPLGDRSSVNLRGEFHVDNVTVYDTLPSKSTDSPRAMHIDGIEANPLSSAERQGQTTSAEVELGKVNDIPEATSGKPPVALVEKKSPSIDADTLYPMFWSLQEYFSNPTKLFDSSNLAAFKSGLQATLDKFKQVHVDSESRGSIKVSDESKRGIKRKREGGQDMASSFNPKYLTNRDLFELEVWSDTSES